ncbi:hypothetical protein J6590_064498 [Homalodisca vitripennis]|nr:hypothetical protein J6590_064498 [Homalodisca vitripennis]
MPRFHTVVSHPIPWLLIKGQDRVPLHQPPPLSRLLSFIANEKDWSKRKQNLDDDASLRKPVVGDIDGNSMGDKRIYSVTLTN